MDARRWAAPEAVEARVVAGGVPIPYVQAGDGAPAILLCPTSWGDPAKTLFFGKLSRHLRVVAPVSPSGGDVHAAGGDSTRVAFSCWLRDFIDGLGLARVSLVAGGSFGIPALEVAVLDPDRVERTVLVFEDELDPAVPVITATDRLGVAGTALLVMRVAGEGTGPGPGTTAGLGDLVRFLTDPDESGPEGTGP